jgi:hypothetical protein
MKFRRGGQREEESRPLADFGLDPDAAAITLHKSLARGQSDAGAGILLPVEPFEEFKDLRLVLRRNSLTIVGNREQPFPARLAGRYVNTRGILPAILEGIAD